MFDESRVLDFHLTFPAGAWDKLLNPVGPQDQHWVPCTFRFDGQTFEQAACRRKGNAEHWPEEKKPQMIVRFNLADAAGRFRGLRRLNLESFYETGAPIRDRLAMWMMREAGLPSSRVNHVRVFKDGALLGLYQNIEAVDKEFLERHFGADAGGNLWEAGEPMELKTNETDQRSVPPAGPAGAGRGRAADGRPQRVLPEAAQPWSTSTRCCGRWPPRRWRWPTTTSRPAG